MGANFVLHQSLAEYFRVFHDARVRGATARGGRLLLEGGLQPDGTARRSLDVAQTGNLRDQADTGSGLLAYHALSGDPAAISAAHRLGDALLDLFWDSEAGAFRNVSRTSALPASVRNTDPLAAWNGSARAWRQRTPRTEAPLAQATRRRMSSSRSASVVTRGTSGAQPVVSRSELDALVPRLPLVELIGALVDAAGEARRIDLEELGGQLGDEARTLLYALTAEDFAAEEDTAARTIEDTLAWLRRRRARTEQRELTRRLAESASDPAAVLREKQERRLGRSSGSDSL